MKEKRFYLFILFFLTLYGANAQGIDSTHTVFYEYCAGNSVTAMPITPPQSGCTYRWNPTLGVSDSNAATPVIQAYVTMIYERIMVCGTDTTLDYVIITVKVPVSLLFVPALLPDTTVLCLNQGNCVTLTIPDIIHLPYSSEVPVPFTFLSELGYTQYDWGNADIDTSTEICQEGMIYVSIANPTDSFCNAIAAQTYVQVQTDCTTALSLSESFSPNISPNPFNNTLSVKNIKKGSWELYDIQGKLLYSGKLFGNTDILTESWQKGIYFLRTESENRFFVHKIIKE